MYRTKYLVSPFKGKAVGLSGAVNACEHNYFVICMQITLDSGYS